MYWPDMVPCTAAVLTSPVLVGKEIVHLNLNDRRAGTLLVSYGSCPQLWDLYLQFCCCEIWEDQQAAGEGRDDEYLDGSHNVISITFSTPHISHQIAAGVGSQADGTGQKEDQQCYPFPLELEAELQVEGHLEVTDDTHNSWKPIGEKSKIL